MQKLASLKEQVSHHITWLEQQITYLLVISADQDAPITVIREEVVKNQAQLRDLVSSLVQDSEAIKLLLFSVGVSNHSAGWK